MKTQIAVLVLVAAGSAGSAAAQHPDHQASGSPGSRPSVEVASACVQSHQRGVAILDQISRRLDARSGSSSPSDVRTAMDDLQAALVQMRTALEGCFFTNPAPPGVGTAKPAPAMDHAAMGHTMPATKPAEVDPQLVSACLQSQKESAGLTDRLSRRLELARQTNRAADMRAAKDDLPPALGELKAALQKCEPLRAAVAAVDAVAPTMDQMDHSKMPMGVAPPAGTGAKPAMPAGQMDHSKMAMGATPAAPAGGKPSAPAPMDHSKMPMGGGPPAARATGDDRATMKMGTPKLPVLPAQRIPDPACRDTAGQPNAPKAVYQRKVYYFCSVADRDQFMKDPAGYLKKRPR